MKLDIPAKDFQKLSANKKKEYLGKLFVRESGAHPVESRQQPIAVVMAGLPGAGKTEYLDVIADELREKQGYDFVRIDLDEILGVYPDYQPKDYYKFRSQGNLVVARTIDEAIRGNYNMLIDGTFAGSSKVSIGNIDRLLMKDYIVQMIYMYDSLEVAWDYTEKRRIETGRIVERDGFLRASRHLTQNLREVVELFRDNPNFSIKIIVQKILRDREYNVITQKDDVDKIIHQDYNEDQTER